MKVLYIGQYTEGTTSKMRADILKKVSNCTDFDVIDTHIPFFATSSFFRSLGFRYKIGPLIWFINKYIKKQLRSIHYDLIWVDKAVFVSKKNTLRLKSTTNKIVHFTPDMAFFENQSFHFEQSIYLYDFLITTKTIEKQLYSNKVAQEKLLVTTQGYSKNVHCPFHTFSEKDNSVVFIGLAESSRFDIVEYLLINNIRVKLVGKGWHDFVLKHTLNNNLCFLGETIYGEEYAKLISSSKFALGLLSKRFNELHTTRTFEIPACGTVLLTEKNEEISSFYTDDEAIFYQDVEDLVMKIKNFEGKEDLLESIATKGFEKVTHGNFDYESIISRLLNQIMR